ncbi:MAG: DUF3488 domain-containing protein [Gammaproteobacteria bacterium]|nr:DUF3488 domain-containing protein [Gammaproteobacteria bacterium]
MSGPASTWRPLAWAAAALAGGVLLQADRLPLWATLAALAAIGWRLAAERRALWLPGALQRALLALALAAVVLTRFRTLNGLTAGTTLLLLMAALKLLETKSTRDARVLIAAGLFLLLAACLDRQDLVRTPLYALQTLLCCAALAGVAAPTLAPGRAVRLAGRALLAALPLALLFFLFFPRLAGGFWAVPRGESASTGLGDSMDPGSIMQLISNYEPAFRVRFEGTRPPPQALYWRGPVLHQFDGHAWRRGPERLRLHAPLADLREPVRYQVTLEPSQRRWWFALERPARAPAGRVFLTYDEQLIGAEPVTEPLTYEAVSYLRTRTPEPPAAQLREDLTPPPGNPRTLELARTLRAQAGSDTALVAAALDYLRRGGFSYSLTPAPLGADAVDDLLFHTHEGFCGHYASAFVALMRDAQIPARVVTGYLGGEWNPIGSYLVVRQSDAHAWAEVWLPGTGWTRVDPTAVVAPERLRRGVFDLLPEAFTARDRLLHAPWLRAVLAGWDAANSWWGVHVVKFSYESQLDVLRRLGIRTPDIGDLGRLFMAGLLLWLGWAGLRAAPRGALPRPDALGAAYLRLCRKLARAGLRRAPHEGPLALAERCAIERPALAPAVDPLLQRYAQLRFGAGEDARAVREFARAVGRLALAG